MFIKILKHTESGREFNIGRNADGDNTCVGCAFDDETEMCLNAGNACQDSDRIWTEILKVEKVD